MIMIISSILNILTSNQSSMSKYKPNSFSSYDPDIAINTET